MALDTSKLPESVRKAFTSRGLTNEEAEKLTVEQAFIEYCEWHGLRQWGRILLDVYTSIKNAEQSSPKKLSFDLWRNDRWIGMAEGATVQEARQMVVDSGLQGDIIMTPFYGLKTSKETYKAMTGRDGI
jgi:hypothetical protein